MTLRQLRRVRWAVRAVLCTAVAASVAANILHADPNPIAQTIAAWPPLALLATIELVSKVPVSKMPLALCRLLAAGVIAAIAAWVSYGHMAGVALRYGESASSAHLLPLSVDGLVVVASVCLVELAGRIAKVGTERVGGSEAPRTYKGPPAPTTKAATSSTNDGTSPTKPLGESVFFNKPDVQVTSVEPLKSAPPDTAPDPVPDLPPALVAVAAADAEQPGLSKAELAAAAGVSPSAVARYRRINGKTPVLTPGGK